MAMGKRFLSILAAASVLIQPSIQQQQDPLKNFCRRFGHQTAVIDNRLYIDGGYENFNPLDQNPGNYSNAILLYADLNVDNQGMPQEFTTSSKPAIAPDVAGGVLWADTVNKMMFLYGGEFQNTPQGFSMWSYDAIYDKWATLSPDTSQAGIQRASYGAGVAVQDRGLGFWYGGWLSNLTIPAWGVQPQALSNMLQYDLVHNTWTNSSGPDTIGRAEGIMTYIPASDGGMLVYFGGIQTPYGNGTWVGQPMDTIFLYDISNAKWYTQKATGDIPDMRRRFCGGVSWSNDQSSYNIYLYGGASMPPLTVGFDDIYILSLPTFTWIKWYPTVAGTAYPHHSLTCNVINNNQMLVMGGTFPNSTACDDAPQYGFHNMDLGKQNADNAKWALFQNNKTGYKVPSEIIAVVGGGAQGGATNISPKSGFSNPDLSVYFTRVAKPASSRTPTRAIPASTSTPKPNSPSKKNTGAIIGGAVGGGVVVIAILAAGVFCCLKGKRKSAVAPESAYIDPSTQMDPKMYPAAGQTTYAASAPMQAVQLDASQPRYVAELQGGDVNAAVAGVGLQHTSWNSAEKTPRYSLTPALSGASHPSSPSQSPPPVTTPGGGYYVQPQADPNAIALAAPAYMGHEPMPQPHFIQQQPVYFVAPPHGGQYYPPPQQPGYSPPPPQQYPSPTTVHSELGTTTSPANVLPRREVGSGPAGPSPGPDHY